MTTETRTPEEIRADTLVAEYLETVAALGVSDADARALETLMHCPPAARVVDLVPVEVTPDTDQDGGRGVSHVAAPGVGLGLLTKRERAQLLRLTRDHYAKRAEHRRALPPDFYATPGPKSDGWVTDPALLALYDKTRPTAEEIRAERESRGWGTVPTWTEWATARQLGAAVVEFGHHRVRGGWSSSLRPAEQFIRVHDFSLTLWNPNILERALALFEEVQGREGRRRTPPNRPLRQGANFLEGISHGALAASKALERKRQEVTENEHHEILSESNREGLELFRYEPLTWAERLAVTALANIALAEKRLEESPSALSVRPLVDAPQPRIRIPFPGYSELAKWCGAMPGPDGRMPRGLTKALKHALDSLSKSTRWITEPVLVRDKGGALIPRYRINQALWVEMNTIYPTGETAMDLHPAAVGSILRSYVERAPDLYERYESARKSIGAREMRNEWSILEDYLLRRALIVAGDAFRQSLPEKARSGKAKKAARAAAKLTDHGEAEGERTVEFDISRTHLWELLKLDAVAKKQGRSEALERERDAFAFCKATGTLLARTERLGKNGDTVFVCTLPHPDRGRYDPSQLTMLPPAVREEVTP